MRTAPRILLMLILASALAACIDATVPRLPGPGDDEPGDTTKSGKRGYSAPVDSGPSGG